LVFDEIAIAFNALNEDDIIWKNEEEKELFETAFQYMTQGIRSHIANKIGKESGSRGVDKGTVGKRKGKYRYVYQRR
jgi:phosphoribosylformimino-5-aminoimidazole carboxamide ribonucleotide (ProFAR) isomerase